MKKNKKLLIAKNLLNKKKKILKTKLKILKKNTRKYKIKRDHCSLSMKKKRQSGIMTKNTERKGLKVYLIKLIEIPVRLRSYRDRIKDWRQKRKTVRSQLIHLSLTSTVTMVWTNLPCWTSQLLEVSEIQHLSLIHLIFIQKKTERMTPLSNQLTCDQLHLWIL